MTQPPHPPGDDQPYQQHPQQPSQHNQGITGSSQSAGRPEDTQQLPPQGQGSAGHPYAGAYSQPSGGNPYNQPYSQPSNQPYQQPSAGGPYEQTQPYAANQPPTGPSAGSASFGSWQPQPPQHQRRATDANPLKAAFDFSFNSYATPGLVKIIYILAAIVAGLWWIGGGLVALISGIAASSYGGGGAIFLGVVGLLLGWIPALLWLLFVRIILEASLALVRVADDARHIRTKIDD